MMSNDSLPSSNVLIEELENEFNQRERDLLRAQFRPLFSPLLYTLFGVLLGLTFAVCLMYSFPLFVKETISVTVLDRRLTSPPITFDFNTDAERAEFLSFVQTLEKD